MDMSFGHHGWEGQYRHKEYDVRIDVEGVLQEPRYQAKRREGVQDYPGGQALAKQSGWPTASAQRPAE